MSIQIVSTLFMMKNGRDFSIFSKAMHILSVGINDIVASEPVFGEDFDVYNIHLEYGGCLRGFTGFIKIKMINPLGRQVGELLVQFLLDKNDEVVIFTHQGMEVTAKGIFDRLTLNAPIPG